MTWKDWLLHRKVQGSVFQPPPPRLVGVSLASKLTVKINTGDPKSWDSMQTPAEWEYKKKPSERGPSWDLPGLPARFDLALYEVPEISLELIEIVQIVPDDRGMITTRTALSSLLGSRWASQPHALTFGGVQRKHIWSAFPSCFPRVRVIFPGTVWSDRWGNWWSPCVDLTARTSRFDFACLGNADNDESGAWLAFEYAAIVASP